MKLFKLEALEAVGYDSYDIFVIRAESEEHAREMAQEEGADECSSGVWNVKLSFWTNPILTSCVEITSENGSEEIICSSFRAG